VGYLGKQSEREIEIERGIVCGSKHRMVRSKWQGRAGQGRAGQVRAGQGRTGHLVSNVLVGYRLDVIIRHYRSAVLTIKIPEKEKQKEKKKERERERERERMGESVSD
jgi:phage/plasmid primase-like uncharacterized protein